jgi:hypothetical protein
MIDRLATKHEPRRCTTCRDFLKHEKATRGAGNWIKKLGPVHLVPRPGRRQRFACGRPHKPGMYWTFERKLATCRTCKRTR